MWLTNMIHTPESVKYTTTRPFTVNSHCVSKMTTDIVKDIGEIYARVFDHHHFLGGEIEYFLKQFEGNRKDREIENLFTTVQTTIDAKETSVERCRILSQDNLPLLKYKLEDTLTLCENVLNRKADPELATQLEKNRVERNKIWTDFDDDLKHKESRLDNTFEEKEEELREFYSDLERKLHIHK